MRRVLVLTVAMGTMLALAAPASAAKPQLASGTEQVLDFGLTFDPAGNSGNTVITLANPGVRTGTFDGEQWFDGFGVIFADGSSVFHGTIYFEGTVSECSDQPGTAIFKVTGKVDAAGNVYRNHQVTVGGGTLPVHAVLDVPGSIGQVGTVTGSFQCT